MIEPKTKIHRIDYTGTYSSIHNNVIRVVSTSGDCTYLSLKEEYNLQNKVHYSLSS